MKTTSAVSIHASLASVTRPVVAEPMERRLLLSGTTSAFTPLAAGDFNDDGFGETLVRVSAGRARLAGLGFVGSAFRRGALLMLDDGGALFGDPLGIRARGNAAPLAAVADFNGDGRLDLVLAGRRLSGASGGLSFLAGNGDGTFSSGVAIGGAPSNITSLAAGDVNGDGSVDLIGTSRVRGNRGAGALNSGITNARRQDVDTSTDNEGVTTDLGPTDFGAGRPHLVGAGAEAGGGVVTRSTLLPSGTGAGFNFGDSPFADAGFDISLAPGFTPAASRVGAGAEAGGARLGGRFDPFLDGESFEDTDQVFVLFGDSTGAFSTSTGSTAD